MHDNARAAYRQAPSDMPTVIYPKKLKQERELKDIINEDIRRTNGEYLLYRLCGQYFIHCFQQSEQVKQKLKKTNR